MNNSAVRLPSRPWQLSMWGRLCLMFLMLCAGYQFVHVHLIFQTSYLVIPDYLAGLERLPFQRRVLPMLLLRSLLHLHLTTPHKLNSQPLFTYPPLTWLLMIDLVGFAAAAFFTIRLYYKASASSRFIYLVYPLLLNCVIWTYSVNTRAFYYPYDMLSLGFFAAGLYFIYTRAFLPLLLVTFIGSFNRESTFFFIPIFILDILPLGEVSKACWHRIPWFKTTLLAAVWIAVKLFLAHFYQRNDASEDFVRLRWNIQFINPTYWPQLLSAGGFVLPIVWFLRRRIPDRRIASYVLILPLWVTLMCFYGALAEVRIYGELCPLVAVAAALILDSYASPV